MQLIVNWLQQQLLFWYACRRAQEHKRTYPQPTYCTTSTDEDNKLYASEKWLLIKSNYIVGGIKVPVGDNGLSKTTNERHDSDTKWNVPLRNFPDQ